MTAAMVIGTTRLFVCVCVCVFDIVCVILCVCMFVGYIVTTEAMVMETTRLFFLCVCV